LTAARTIIILNELERYRGSLHSTKNVCMGFNKPLCEILFYKIYTMILFNELERHREALNEFVFIGLKTTTL
jgi:hypothetical protein